jgi:hypothetical protein
MSSLKKLMADKYPKMKNSAPTNTNYNNPIILSSIIGITCFVALSCLHATTRSGSSKHHYNLLISIVLAIIAYVIIKNREK